MDIREVGIDAIKLGDHPRKDLGDLEALARSIERDGLLRYPRVTSDFHLIAGRRLVEIARQQGKTTILVVVEDVEDLLRAQLADNALHKRYTPSEMVEIARRLGPAEVEAARTRQQSGQKVRGSSPKGKAWDRIAQQVGTSRKTLDKVFEVVEGVEAEPKFQWLVEQMDRTGMVDGAHKILREYRDDPEAFGKNEHGYLVRRGVTRTEEATIKKVRVQANKLASLSTSALRGSSSALTKQAVLGEVLGMAREVFWEWAKAEGLTATEATEKLSAHFNKYPG